MMSDGDSGHDLIGWELGCGYQTVFKGIWMALVAGEIGSVAGDGGPESGGSKVGRVFFPKRRDIVLVEGECAIRGFKNDVSARFGEGAEGGHETAQIVRV